MDLPSGSIDKYYLRPAQVKSLLWQKCLTELTKSSSGKKGLKFARFFFCLFEFEFIFYCISELSYATYTYCVIDWLIDWLTDFCE